MKKNIILIALSAAMLTGCTSTKLVSVCDNERGEISWNAFCDVNGYDRNDNTYTVLNEYLNTWCDSTEEEKAFFKAGVKPY